MNNTKLLNVSDPASAAVYEIDRRRFVVNTAYQDNSGSPLAELLLRIMVNDGKQPSENHDAGR